MTKKEWNNEKLKWKKVNETRRKKDVNIFPFHFIHPFFLLILCDMWMGQWMKERRAERMTKWKKTKKERKTERKKWMNDKMKEWKKKKWKNIEKIEKEKMKEISVSKKN